MRLSLISTLFCNGVAGFEAPLFMLLKYGKDKFTQVRGGLDRNLATTVFFFLGMLQLFLLKVKMQSFSWLKARMCNFSFSFHDE